MTDDHPPRRQRRTKANAKPVTVVEIQNCASGAVLSLDGGLYFRATGRNDLTGKAFGRWSFRFSSADPEFIAAQERKGIRTRQREKGIGPFPEIPLKDARTEAARLAVLVRGGIDPIEVERRDMAARLAEARQVRLTFAEAVKHCLAAKLDGFKSARHRDQWGNTLTQYALPELGAMAVRDVDTPAVLRVLMQQTQDRDGQDEGPLWQTRAVTASRLRGRIEAVLTWATVAGHRPTDTPNPARWAGNLRELLPATAKPADEAKQPALALDDAPRWFQALRQRDGMAARALEFLALTAGRSGEIRGATWAEIDLKKGLWIVPASRMKAGREHRVPLSAEAVALLGALPKLTDNPLVFPTPRGDQATDAALSDLMKRLHEADFAQDETAGFLDPRSKRIGTPHGLRSTFRQWTAERGFARDMAELQLAHAVASEVERSYQRSDMLDRRRAMLTDWAGFLEGRATQGAAVIAFSAKGQN